METATLLLIVLVLGGGVAGGLLSVWGIARRTFTLEADVADLQAMLLREIKKRAGESAGRKKDELEDFARAVLARQAQEQSTNTPWWLTFKQKGHKP